MNKSVAVFGKFDADELFADLGLDFAMRPVYRISFELDQKAVQCLAEKFADRIFRSCRRATPQGLQWELLLLRFSDDAVAVAMGDYRQTGEVYAATASQAEAIYQELNAALRPESATPKPFFYMLRMDYSDVSTEVIRDVPAKLEDDFLQLCYGTDIMEWMDTFDRRTRDKLGGLTIFEGRPGTGKTTLLSQLIRRLTDTHVFYVLPEASETSISSPSMVTFWQEQNKTHPDRTKVIVMEDAERVLLRRESDNHNAVSALLNIADGLMGRMLRLHILCSMNGKMSELDPAILRPGRLTNYRQFGLLSRSAAAEIARTRGVAFEDQSERDEFTLAEVLNPVVVGESPQKKQIGF